MALALSGALDQPTAQDRRWSIAAAALPMFALPALHPLLMPVVGVPSHLLWFAHALPAALVPYGFGARGGAVPLLSA